MEKNLLKRTFLRAVCLFIFAVALTAVPAMASITISKTSATIQVGKSVTLQVKENGKNVSGAAWGSSDSSVATVSGGKVTGKAAGSAVITAMYNGETVECIVSVVKSTTTGTVRYNVLVLDCSSSMKGTPMTRAKTAAKRFAKAVLAADGTNYVAVVSLNSTSKIACGFSSSYSTVSSSISSLAASGNTNMYAAFENAHSLMKGVSSGSNVMKNVILCSDGLPRTGNTLASGKYTSSDHKYYKYANAVYKLDTTMKSAGQFIYALGFFHNSSGNNLVFGKRLMKDLASKDKYYNIRDIDDIDDAFDDIIKKVTSVTISETALTMYVGDTAKLTAYVNGVAKSATWKSTASSIASVSSSGKVTAKKAGTCTIKATVAGKTVTCKVTVKNKITLKLNASAITLNVGEKYVLKATVTGSSSSVKWSSNNSSIATVTSAGVVTGRKAGTTYVYAKVGGKTAKCKVTVKSSTRPLYSVYFTFNATKYYWTSQMINEEGIRIQTNTNGVIEKSAAYIYRSGSYWHVALAFKGYKNTVTSATIYAYVAYKGKTVRDASSYSRLNHFSMSKDSSGIWSMGGAYRDIYFNVTNTNGKIVADAAAKRSSSNMKVFTSLSAMKNYLKS